MASTTIVVSSRALGPRLRVRVVVYDTLEEMRAAGHRYNGSTDLSAAAGVTQAWTDTDQYGRTRGVIVRLARGYLGTRIVSHEMHHAATALYGSMVGDRVSRLAHLNHHNEPFAHLFSDLLHRLVDRLYELGYYDRAAD